jgi:hypothetical protein
LKGGPWTGQLVRFTGSCLTAAASVLVMSSMMVFYKKVEATERESLERQERILTGILPSSKLGTKRDPMGK